MRLPSPKPGVSVKLPKTLGHIGFALLSLPLAVPAAADLAHALVSQHAQWIVVGVPAANATTGTLTAFQRVGQQWKVVLGPMPAKVGELGVGVPGDGVHRTPVGTFAFDQAFGRQPDPGTKMPYFQATDQDWWDEDAKSPTYNTHVRGSGSPSSIAENLYDSGPVYDYAVNLGNGSSLRAMLSVRVVLGRQQILHAEDHERTAPDYGYHSVCLIFPVVRE